MSNLMSLSRAFGVALAAGAASGASALAASDVQAIAMTGAAGALGPQSGSDQFVGLGTNSPSLDTRIRSAIGNNGVVAISGRFGATPDYGVWRWRAGIGLDLTKQSGDTAPGAGVPLGALYNPSPFGVDRIGYVGEYFTPTMNIVVGLFKAYADGAIAVSCTGSPAPGTCEEIGALQESNDSILVMNEDGWAVYRSFAVLPTPPFTSSNRLLMSDGGSPVLLAAKGSSPGGGFPAYDAFRYPTINLARDVSFFAELGTNAANDEAVIFRTVAGAVEVVNREGDLIDATRTVRNPNMFSGTPDRDWAFLPSRINNDGDLVYVAALGNAGGTAYDSLWVRDGGVTGIGTRIGLSGDAVPGVTGAVFDTPTLSGGFRTVFWGPVVTRAPGGADPLVYVRARLSFSGTKKWAILRYESGSFDVMAMEGDSAPGTSPSMNWTFLAPPVTNGNGQVAFWGFAATPTPGSSVEGIWASQIDSPLYVKKVVFEGDRIYADGQLWDVDPGLSIVERSGGQDGLPMAINDDGRMVVLANVSSGMTSREAILHVGNTTCPADMTGDGLVDAADVAQLLGSWGACATPGCPGDLNGDGQVNAADQAELSGSWGACP